MSARTQFAYALPGKDPLRYASALHTLPYTLFFDSADRTHPQARYSFIAFMPFETLESKGGRISVTNREQQLSFIGDPFRIVQQRMDVWGLNGYSQPDLPPFQGGAAGCFGYDLARQLERLPVDARDDKSMPDMMVGLYDQVLAFDHQKNRAWFITHAESEEQAKTRFHHLRKLTDDAPAIEPQTAEAEFAPELMRHEYEDRIARVIEYVHAGDIFQANLSQRFVADMPRDFDAFAHYLHLRNVSPAPFASYMNFGSIKLASASPERFLKLENWQVETRPIKGTAPRHADAMEDARSAKNLQNSEKDRAENAMIVDLLRNDLSKVCQDHSVDVPLLCSLESFAQVHHLVSVVKGMLNATNTPLELLRACFPGGSVSGAPKVRAMEIIEELEDNRRGPYCGAMGYIGIGGTMDTNIIIRTLVHNGQRTNFNVGGGIVADSKPKAEYDETLAKAEGMLKSFTHPQPAHKDGVQAERLCSRLK